MEANAPQKVMINPTVTLKNLSVTTLLKAFIYLTNEILEDIEKEKSKKNEIELQKQMMTIYVKSLINTFSGFYSLKKFYLKDLYKKIMKFCHNLIKDSSTIVVSFIYLERLLNVDCYVLNNQTYMNLISCAIALACKYNEDGKIKDKFFAYLINQDIYDFVLMESFFCEGINYDFYISSEEYYSYFSKIIDYIDSKTKKSNN